MPRNLDCTDSAGARRSTRAVKWSPSARAALIAAAVLASGCAEELGPEPMQVTSLSGRVTLSGKPVGRGFLEFVPVEGTVGRLRSARLRPDGSFLVKGVPVGEVGIRLVGVGRLRSGDPRVDEILAYAGQVALFRATIPVRPEHPLLIDVAVESARLDRSLKATDREASDP